MTGVEETAQFFGVGQVGVHFVQEKGRLMLVHHPKKAHSGLIVLRSSGEFNRQEGLAEASREALSDREGVCQVCKLIVVLRIRV